MISEVKMLIDELKGNVDKGDSIVYYIPRLWLYDGMSSLIKDDKGSIVSVNPYSYMLAIVEEILKHSQDKSYEKPFYTVDGNITNGNWIKTGIIYAFLIRLIGAFDHNLDGILGSENTDDITLNSNGIRETGTFLKGIALLPYLKRFNITTIYLQPVSLPGIAYTKGELSSPYCIRNPFKIDPILADPIVNLDSEKQFKLFCYFAHILGFRVILDFAFRTASRDSDWIPQHPDWFYWIKRDKESVYGMPEFSDEELDEIFRRVANKDFNTIPPHKEYIEMFTRPPRREDVRYVSKEQGYIGMVDGKEVIVPGAFADWPPNDIQPPWTDVTYLKLYTDEEFNYIAYNTVRMYDKRIQNKNEELWKTIEGIIPYYVEKFGIDGARIDMGHALPHKLEELIIKEARRVNPDFAFLSEDFNSHADVDSKGYNLVMGNSWYIENSPVVKEGGMHKAILREFMGALTSNPSFVVAASETPDTPRVAERKFSMDYSRMLFAINCLLPKAVPFINAGQEFGEMYPVNLGLDFSREYIAEFQKEGKKLPLFDKVALSWEKADKELLSFYERMTEIRKQYIDIIELTDKSSFGFLPTSYKKDGDDISSTNVKNIVIGFVRKGENKTIGIIANMNDERVDIDVRFTDVIKGKLVLKDVLKDREIAFDSSDITIKLDKYDFILFEVM